MARALPADECPARTAPVTLAAPRLAPLCGALAGLAAVAFPVSTGPGGVALGQAPLTAAAPSTSAGAFLSGTSSDTSAAAGSPAPRAAARAPARQRTDLERQTGLSVTIKDVQRGSLVKGQPLTVTGSVSNSGHQHWRDAQVYLELRYYPATTRADLDAFASQETVYDTRLIALSQFDQIGPVRPGKTKTYRLSVPFHLLPIAGTPGVYHVGVSVLAQNEDGRDLEPDARVATLVPLLPTTRGSGFLPTSVVTMVPLTAPVLQQSNGHFVDDELASQLSVGGRLRDVIDVVRRAPRRSLQVVVDPALLAAVRTMSAGYVVQSLAEAAKGLSGRPGTGQAAAAAWLHEFATVARRQRVSLMIWGAPDVSALAAHHMPGIVTAAVTAARSYATRNSLDPAIVGWQPGGFSTRPGLSAMARSGTSLHVVAERSLAQLPASDSGYRPTTVSVPTASGPLTTVVSRHDVAGKTLTASTPALQFRQRVLAEATVRSLADDPRARAVVFTLPLLWDPGPVGRAHSLTPAYRSAAVRPTTLARVAARAPTPYDGPVHLPPRRSEYPAKVLAATASLRHNGRVFTGILSSPVKATDLFDQRLGIAGSTAWRDQPRIAAALIRSEAAAFAMSIAKVTVTGPNFVALSSASGRFPITVTNGLAVPITVRVDVRPLNPALHVDSINNLQLAAGQRLDRAVVTRAEGSGLTQVRLRLSTPDHRRFGSPWSFNVRATQFGVAIWIAMGAGAAVLFGAAVLRIYRRIRGSRRTDRTSPATR